MPDPDLLTRIGCVVMAGLALIMLLVRVQAWRRLDLRLRMYGFGLFLLVSFVGYGVVEGIAIRAPGGPRFALVACALAVIALASLIPSDRWLEHRRHRQEHSDPQQEDR